MRALIILLFAFSLATGAFAALTIVKDGQPRAIIVTAAEPSASARRAAEELQHFIELMSGAKLPIQDDAALQPFAGPLLLVGRSGLVKGVQIPSGDDLDHTREGFVLKTQGNTLILAGNEDGEYHGTEYAVYELLNRLGCRWYFPGEFGQVAPKTATISVPDLNVAQKPSFTVRNIWTSGWADITGDNDAFMLRNKGSLRGGFAFPGDGTINNLAPVAKYAKDFPDIYAMDRNGKRQDENTEPQLVMLCTTNPKAVEIAANSIADHFRAHPEANSFGFSAPDSNAVCYCPDCVARMHDILLDSGIGESISDPYFNFVNNLAWKVNEQFPDKYIVVLAYASRVTPPEGLDRPWNPHIIIQLAQLRVSALHPIGTPTDYSALRQLRTVKQWSRITPKMLIYDYDPHADLSRMPFWRSRAIARDMKLYKSNNVIGFTTEGNNTFFRTGLNYYVRARLMWDVNTDIEKLLDDFYTNFFGPASAPMKQFCEEIEAMLQATTDRITWQPLYVDWTPTYPPAQVAALGKLLDQAEAKANTPELRQRIRLYRILHGYMTADLNVYALEHQGKYAAALVELDKMPKLIAEAEGIQKGLLPPDPGWVLNEGRGFNHLKNYLTMLADSADGKLGELLALAPEKAQFMKDPTNIGLYDEWMRDGAKAVKWESIDLTRDWSLNGYRDAEGYAYDGIGWYRIAMKVKKPAAGRAQLLLPLVYAEKLWIWLNGEMVYSPTMPLNDYNAGPAPGRAVLLNNRGGVTLALDIQDHLKPGAENVFTFRMTGSQVRTQHRGFADRPLVWAPK